MHRQSRWLNRLYQFQPWTELHWNQWNDNTVAFRLTTANDLRTLLRFSVTAPVFGENRYWTPHTNPKGLVLQPHQITTTLMPCLTAPAIPGGKKTVYQVQRIFLNRPRFRPLPPSECDDKATSMIEYGIRIVGREDYQDLLFRYHATEDWFHRHVHALPSWRVDCQASRHAYGLLRSRLFTLHAYCLKHYD